jgi:hypothetical protein
MPLDMRGIMQLVQQNPQLAQMLFDKMKELQTLPPAPDAGAEPDFPPTSPQGDDLEPAPYNPNEPYGPGYQEWETIPSPNAGPPSGAEINKQPLQGPRPRLENIPQDQLELHPKLLYPNAPKDIRLQDEHYNEAIAGPDYEDI